MKTAFLKLAAVIVCAVCTHIVYAQCTTYPIALNERIAKSKYMVIGEVSAQHCYADKDGNIYTLNKIAVHAWLKNYQPDAAVYVITNGGILNDKAQVTIPSLQLVLHNQYAIMLDENNTVTDDKTTRSAEPLTKQSFAYADAEGAMLYQDNLYVDVPENRKMNEQTALQTIYNITNEKAKTPAGIAYAGEKEINVVANLLSPAITGLSPNPTNAGTIVTSDFLTITGSGFGAAKGKVEFKNADDGGATYVSVINSKTDYVSWSDNSITVKVPDNAGTGTIRVNGITSSQILTINYAQESVNTDFYLFTDSTRQRYYLRNIADPAGYIFKYNVPSGFSTNTPAVQAFERAMNTWKCKTGINWISSGTTTAGVGNGEDGTNVVEFDNTLPAGTLGSTTYRLDAGGTSNCSKENTVWFLKEVDMRFAPNPKSGYSWQFGPALPTTKQYDFESVTLHELGHAHGLAHQIAPDQTMNYSLANGTAIRVPSTAEINGANNKMSYSTVPTCFNPAGSGVPMKPASCVLPVNIISFKAALQNQHVLVTWQTASEINAAYFTVERSVNGIDFVPVGKINAAGNSTSANNYSYTDDVSALAAGAVYYRLRETDKDGQFAISGINTVNILGRLFIVYPNPAHNYINIEGRNITLVQIVDAAGKLITQKNVSGEYRTTINTSAISKGAYILIIKDSKGNNDNRKLVIE